MKTKILLFVVLILATFSLVLALPDFVPPGASWRIDIAPGNLEAVCEWREVSHINPGQGAEGGEWGQGRCDRLYPYGSCHCYDWLTWWFGITWVPEPPEGWESIYGSDYFPTYNPATGRYE